MGKRAGRRRKVTVVRQPNGQPRRENTDAIIGVALRQRTARVGAERAKDPMAGYALGRLRLRDHITEDQHEAGLRFAEVVTRYGGMMGFDLTGPHSPAPMVAGGATTGPESSPERIAHVRAEYRDMMRAILDMCRAGIDCGPVLSIMRAICLRDEDERYLAPERIGDLRLGLNAVHRHISANRRTKVIDRGISSPVQPQLIDAGVARR